MSASGFFQTIVGGGNDTVGQARLETLFVGPSSVTPVLNQVGSVHIHESPYTAPQLHITHDSIGSTANDGFSFTLTAAGALFLYLRENQPISAWTNFAKRWEVDQNSFRLEVALGLKDGQTAPATVAGRAFIYVDTADGDLKVKFGDGTIKTIVTDT